MSQNKEGHWSFYHKYFKLTYPNTTIGVFIKKEGQGEVEARSWVDEGKTYMVYPIRNKTPLRINKNEYTLYQQLSTEMKDRESEMKDNEVIGYEKLQEVLHRAYDQAANGKGKERHSSNNTIPFHEQRMQTISDLIKSPKGMEYQVVKKITEGMEMKETERTTKELLGAINYIAGIIIFLEKQNNQ
tara:strand:+ start:8053 stop:8610 length:558 start_codon:yes stop_codon:yes gene_type:complete